VKHPEEHILELYVLNAESVSDRRAEIEEHIRTCAGCRALAGNISGFYSELDAELRKEDENAPESIGHAVMKRNPELAVWEERLASGPWRGWSAPVKSLRYYIRRYPIAAAGTTFAFAALAGIGLLMGYSKLSEDNRPAYAEMNMKSGFFEVYNRENTLLWKRIVKGMGDILLAAGVTEIPKYTIIDFDGDGSSDVVTPLVLGGQPAIPMSGLHVFDGRGECRTIPYERRVTFRGTPYEYPNLINSGSMMAVDASDPAHPEFYVTAKSDRSPTAVLRINDKGEIVGEYWHHGQMPAIYLQDLNGDGRNELVLCGFNDVDDQTEPSSPFIAVLDPRKIVGLTESRVTTGYGYARSDAELYYVKLPLTEANTFLHEGAGMARMRVDRDRLIFLWGFEIGPELRCDLDFVFSKSFEPLRVISSTQSHQLFERLYSQKSISTRLDEAYLEHLRTQVRFWDGQRWTTEPVRMGGVPMAGPAAE
jgi:hypothetical protein